MITLNCKNCGKAFDVPPYRADKAKYCSRECYLEDRWKSDGVCKVCGKPTNTTYCSIECQRKYWDKNDYHLRKKYRNWERKEAIIKKLGGKCVKCGNDDIRVLDINHKDPEVKHRYSNGYTWQRRLKDWEENIDDIEILCANCHRIYTWEQMGYGV